jgi:hypothetical protein
MKHEPKELHLEDTARKLNEASPSVEKLPYEEPELVVHGKIEKLTLQTGIPGG